MLIILFREECQMVIIFHKKKVGHNVSVNYYHVRNEGQKIFSDIEEIIPLTILFFQYSLFIVVRVVYRRK